MTRYLLCAITVLLVACGGGRKKPDVSNIKVDLQLERFEQAFFRIDSNNIAAGLAGLRNAHPAFYGAFFNNIVGINPNDSSGQQLIRYMLRDYAPVHDSIRQKYPKLDWLREELTGSFRYVKHYFPDYAVPRVVTFISTFDAPGAVLGPGFLGIGLQQFAGKNFSVYQVPEIQQMYPSYISRRFDKEYMTAAAMRAVVDDIYPDQSVGRPLIEQMVEKGKQWFLLDQFLPDAPDSVKTGYTGAQTEWVRENEGNIWSYVTKNENLYSIEPHVIQTYIGESPFTQAMSEASPGNLGPWIGWRIVQAYADAHPDLTPQQLLALPARKLFEGSKYKPK
ncbi:hypothetical protein [Flaviaesturariibacter amylovorans]|uniref:Gliding motility lipoprotein GldB n=1 Tax=Flaviaesturariibacter amylovorans TaxID=1084520 RepID=A0ABP8GD49_9BACT